MRRPGAGPQVASACEGGRADEGDGPEDSLRSDERRKRFRSRPCLEPGIHRLALQREDAEDTLMDPIEAFISDEPLQRLNAEGELP
jgi:hypothetical protein